MLERCVCSFAVGKPDGIEYCDGRRGWAALRYDFGDENISLKVQGRLSGVVAMAMTAV